LDDTTKQNPPSMGVIPLGEHPDTSGNPTVEQVAERAVSNKETALSTLARAQSALQQMRDDLPSAPGDHAIAATRSKLAFCLGQLANEARELEG